ncbi:MAG: haloalkane dehalogenase [Actinomycetes bacterium]
MTANTSLPLNEPSDEGRDLPLVVRSPAERFLNLPDWPYERREVLVPAGPTIPGIETLSVAYVDEGPKDAIPVVMLHGEPTWGYLYRHMMKDLLERGYRVLVPDQIGFGRSDQPTDKDAYTYPAHVSWMNAWWSAVAPKNAVFFGQDWGSLVGLAVASMHADDVRAIVIGNGILGRKFKPQEGGAFGMWQEFAASIEYLECGRMISGDLVGGVKTPLTEAESAAYDAPFPDTTHQAGCLSFPSLMPTSPDQEGAKIMLAAWSIYDTWEKPFATCFGVPDPVTGHGQKYFAETVPGAKRSSHTKIEGVGHYCQELGHSALVAAINEAATQA